MIPGEAEIALEIKTGLACCDVGGVRIGSEEWRRKLAEAFGYAIVEMRGCDAIEIGDEGARFIGI